MKSPVDRTIHKKWVKGVEQLSLNSCSMRSWLCGGWCDVFTILYKKNLSHNTTKFSVFWSSIKLSLFTKESSVQSYSRNSHILIIQTMWPWPSKYHSNPFGVAWHPPHMMMYHHTKFGYKRLRCSEDMDKVDFDMERQSHRSTDGHSDSSIPLDAEF